VVRVEDERDLGLDGLRRLRGFQQPGPHHGALPLPDDDVPFPADRLDDRSLSLVEVVVAGELDCERIRMK
jgi:hypothetical protein